MQPSVRAETGSHGARSALAGLEDEAKGLRGAEGLVVTAVLS